MPEELTTKAITALFEQGPLVIVLLGGLFYMRKISDRERDERIKNQEIFFRLLEDNNKVIKDNTDVVKELNTTISRFITR